MRWIILVLIAVIIVCICWLVNEQRNQIILTEGIAADDLYDENLTPQAKKLIEANRQYYLNPQEFPKIHPTAST